MAGSRREAASAPPIELEHVIGFTGRHAQTLQCHPEKETTYCCALGSHVVVGDVTDPHRQEFLRAHDHSVSAIAISASGTLLASGQEGSPGSATREAPVVVWELESRRPVYNLFGLTGSVEFVAFTADDRFLAAAGADHVLLVWDMQTGEQMAGKKHSSPIEFLTWAPLDLVSDPRRPTYALTYATGGQVYVAPMAFDVKLMRYSMSFAQLTLPGTGFARQYRCGLVDPSGRSLLVGTSSGEVAVFSLVTRVFRAAFPVASNGVLSLAWGGDSSASSAGRGPALYVGGGDGSLRRFHGDDTRWVCTGEAETFLPGPVLSLSAAASHEWLLAGTSLGHILRVAVPELTAASMAASVPPALPPAGRGRGTVGSLISGGSGSAGGGGAGGAGVPATPSSSSAAASSSSSSSFRVDELERSHLGPVTCLSFGHDRSDVFASGSRDGTVRLWDLSDYRVVMEARVGGGAVGFAALSSMGLTGLPVGVGAGRVATVVTAAAPPSGVTKDGVAIEDVWVDSEGEGGVFAACSDGRVRYFRREDGTEAWSISAHRGRATAVAARKNFFVTGGEDGRVSVWARPSRELVLQFADHKGTVLDLVLDVADKSRVHSIGDDRTVITYSLKDERRVQSHQLPRSTAARFTSLTQRRDGEQELLTGSSDGRVLAWDIDIAETPVAEARGESGGPVTRTAVGAMAVSPSGRWLAVGYEDGALRVFHVPTLTVQLDVVAHSSAVLTVAWSPDERQLVTGGADACLSVFNHYGVD